MLLELDNQLTTEMPTDLGLIPGPLAPIADVEHTEATPATKPNRKRKAAANLKVSGNHEESQRPLGQGAAGAGAAEHGVQGRRQHPVVAKRAVPATNKDATMRNYKIPKATKATTDEVSMFNTIAEHLHQCKKSPRNCCAKECKMGSNSFIMQWAILHCLSHLKQQPLPLWPPTWPLLQLLQLLLMTTSTKY